MVIRKTTGIILATQHSGECDRRISFFSETFGRLSIIAKGVRRIRSRRNYHIDLFNHVDIELQETARGLYIREISTIDTFSNIPKRLEHYSSACLISSFLQRAVPLQSPQPLLFALTLQTLISLDGDGTPKEILLTYFLKCARILGFLPNTITKKEAREKLMNMFDAIDPQFTLNARRTLGIFSN